MQIVRAVQYSLEDLIYEKIRRVEIFYLFFVDSSGATTTRY